MTAPTLFLSGQNTHTPPSLQQLIVFGPAEQHHTPKATIGPEGLGTLLEATGVSSGHDGVGAGVTEVREAEARCEAASTILTAEGGLCAVPLRGMELGSTV